MSETRRLQFWLNVQMYRQIKRYGKGNMGQFVRDAIAEKLATYGETVTAEVERGGYRERKS